MTGQVKRRFGKYLYFL